jgi:uncharacterized damage-inducible protein DinB
MAEFYRILAFLPIDETPPAGGNWHRTMKKRLFLSIAFIAAAARAADSNFAQEFGNRWSRTRPLAIGVAEAMPPVQYAFRPDPGSMSFAEQIAHVAQTNYAFCAGLKDTAPPLAPSATDKDALVKFLAGSFDYCSAAIASVTAEQMDRPHSSPDGRLNGRELLLALYVHLAHHRGQQEVYLRIKGIPPPQYVF